MKAIFTYLLIGLSAICNSQITDNRDFLSVYAYVGSAHQCPYHKNPNDITYTAFASVKNNQDSSISFYVMSKSWNVDNLTTDNDSIYSEIDGWSLNTSTEIKLLPKQCAEFTFELTTRNILLANKNFRLGLVLSNERYLPQEVPIKERMKYSKIYWSNELEIQRDPMNIKKGN